MTDKQREALQALAEVMEKYAIVIVPFREECLYVEVDCVPEVYALTGDTLTAEYLREELRDDN